jgi:hypothetical protein
MFFFLIINIYSQSTILSESMRTGSLPSGWSQTSVTFTTAADGYANFTATSSILTSPIINLSTYTNVTLTFYVAKFGSGGDGPITVEVSNDGGSTWTAQTFNSPTPTSSSYELSGPTSITATGSNVRFRFLRINSPSQKRFRDFLLEGDIAMPVNFTKINLQNSYTSTILTFSTASETNNDYFTIERSADGRSFDAIGEIKGAGNNTEEKHYEFTDENPLSGINYYRIKQTDFDGQYSYSEIRSVRHTGKGNVAISPRSTDGRLDISTEMESYDVAIYSSAGQEVARFAALAGHQTVSIDALQAGVYFVKVMSGAESETIRVVKY